MADNLGVNPLTNDVNDLPGEMRYLVKQHIQDNLEKTDPHFDFEVYVVWFTFVLGNYKALISSTLPDGRYYEVTHNKAKGETYIDTYVKINNVALNVAI